MTRRRKSLSALFLAIFGALTVGAPNMAHAQGVMSTEEFLNHLGVNTHLNGLTRSDPWNTDALKVAAQLNYLGVRLDRDWAWSAADGQKWKTVRDHWTPEGRFWTSIDEASPANQRLTLGYEETIWQKFPRLIYALGGPNEEDDTYPQSQGATLPDAARVQQSLYTWAHSEGRNIPVGQMEFGAGWTATNGWRGDYDPQHTGIDQNYIPGPADFGGAHTYLSNPGQRPVDVLQQLRSLANLTTPEKPVAHTEFGAYTHAYLSARVFGQYLVMGAFDSAAAGDSAYLVYGLQDSGPEQTYGFFSYPAGEPHEAADYFHTLTTLLKSAKGRYGPGMPPTFTPAALKATFTHQQASYLTLQKPTGDFVIAAWSEQLMNGSEHRVSETIRFGRPFAALRVYDVEEGVTPIAVQHNVSQFTLRMNPSDTYLLALTSAERV